MPPLDPAEDFEDEGESLHQRRMRQVNEWLRASRRERVTHRGALSLFCAFPVASLGFVAASAWGFLPPVVTALWMIALPVLFIAAVVAGVHLMSEDGAFPFTRHHIGARRRF